MGRRCRAGVGTANPRRAPPSPGARWRVTYAEQADAALLLAAARNLETYAPLAHSAQARQAFAFAVELLREQAERKPDVKRPGVPGYLPV